jgi:hypothetical protein
VHDGIGVNDHLVTSFRKMASFAHGRQVYLFNLCAKPDRRMLKRAYVYVSAQGIKAHDDEPHLSLHRAEPGYVVMGMVMVIEPESEDS